MVGKSADSWVREIRSELRRRGSATVARSMQRFFREPVRPYGWRTAAVRRYAAGLRREITAAGNERLLMDVATKLFAGASLEETTLGVVLLERSVRRFAEPEFRRLETWLPRIRNWAACDALCSVLLGPLVVADGRRVGRTLLWARSLNPWLRRAAVVSLVPAARRQLYTRQVFRLSEKLMVDEDEMVQKGVGWLLREAGKARTPGVVAFLLRVKRRAPRLVLRTACEKLPARVRQRILA